MSGIIEVKRSRGRPKGSEIDDTQTLQAVADILVGSPKMPPMTAMKRVMGRPNDATLHRVNRKWRERGEGLLIVASEERRQRELQQRVAHVTAAITAVGESIQRTLSDPKVRTYLDLVVGILSDPKVQVWLERMQRRTMNDPKVRAWAENVEKTRLGVKLQPWIKTGSLPTLG